MEAQNSKKLCLVLAWTYCASLGVIEIKIKVVGRDLGGDKHPVRLVGWGLLPAGAGCCCRSAARLLGGGGAAARLLRADRCCWLLLRAAPTPPAERGDCGESKSVRYFYQTHTFYHPHIRCPTKHTRNHFHILIADVMNARWSCQGKLGGATVVLVH